jgi:hypothetical protein
MRRARRDVSFSGAVSIPILVTEVVLEFLRLAHRPTKAGVMFRKVGEGRLRMRALSLLCLSLVLAVAELSAQEIPDFSGQWVLEDADASDSNIASEFTVHQSARRTSVLGTPMDSPLVTLTVEGQFRSGIRSAGYDIGVIAGLASPSGQTTKWSVKWTGSLLVFEHGLFGPEREMMTRHSETWSLDVKDRLVVSFADETSSFETEPEWRTITYRRR